MNTKLMIASSSVLAALAGGAFLLTAQQQADVSGIIRQGDKPSIAVPDFRGSGAAQGQMDLYNSTLWDVLSGSGVLTMKAKSMYPLSVPQRPQDFKARAMAPVADRGDAPKVITNGPWLTDWSGPPVSASYL